MVLILVNMWMGGWVLLVWLLCVWCAGVCGAWVGVCSCVVRGDANWFNVRYSVCKQHY
jgi:hypothetical protein